MTPELGPLARRAAQVAGGAVRMSGSGAALFRLFADRQQARMFADRAAHELGVATVVARVGNF